MGSSATLHEEPPCADPAALSITEAERAELQRRVRAHTTPQRAAKRARVVLLAAEGVPNRQSPPSLA
jgi:hypothetical protein